MCSRSIPLMVSLALVVVSGRCTCALNMLADAPDSGLSGGTSSGGITDQPDAHADSTDSGNACANGAGGAFDCGGACGVVTNGCGGTLDCGPCGTSAWNQTTCGEMVGTGQPLALGRYRNGPIVLQLPSADARALEVLHCDASGSWTPLGTIALAPDAPSSVYAQAGSDGLLHAAIAQGSQLAPVIAHLDYRSTSANATRIRIHRWSGTSFTELPAIELPTQSQTWFLPNVSLRMDEQKRINLAVRFWNDEASGADPSKRGGFLRLYRLQAEVWRALPDVRINIDNSDYMVDGSMEFFRLGSELHVAWTESINQTALKRVEAHVGRIEEDQVHHLQLIQGFPLETYPSLSAAERPDGSEVVIVWQALQTISCANNTFGVLGTETRIWRSNVNGTFALYEESLAGLATSQRMGRMVAALVDDAAVLLGFPERAAGCGVSEPDQIMIAALVQGTWSSRTLGAKRGGNFFGLMLTHDATNQPLVLWTTREGIHLMRRAP